MFDILSYVKAHKVEITVRPGRGNTAYELFVRDNAHDLTKYRRITNSALALNAYKNSYIEEIVDEMTAEIEAERTAMDKAVAI